MYAGNAELNDILEKLYVCNKICEMYNWLSDAYVSDFYKENHWEKLPSCWRPIFKNMDPEMLANIINFNAPLHNFQVLPLSLLTLRKLIHFLHIPRQQVVCAETNSNDTINKKIDEFGNLFWKQVKMKKKHEIELMSKLCHKLATDTKCYIIIDVGSGLGHLSRILAFKYGLKVFSFEAQEYLTRQARKLDEQFENKIKKHYPNKVLRDSKPIHINMKIETNSDGHDILLAITNILDVDFNNFRFGIVGLHPCGDLGVTLLRLFIKCPQVKFVNIVGCCYMKLTTELNSSVHECGYPISKFGRDNKFKLSYCSMEVACHALEAYTEKLMKGECWQLKIHAYRAALEKLIVGKWPEMYHCQMSNVKYSKDLTFAEYCDKALSKLRIKLSNSEIDSEDIKNDLKRWKDVVTFYSLRLMVAPLIETTVLLDRLLFILESGNQCYIIPLFNPHLSPRNHVTTGIK